jgi:hypothetical protein
LYAGHPFPSRRGEKTKPARLESASARAFFGIGQVTKFERQSCRSAVNAKPFMFAQIAFLLVSVAATWQ